jgi:hypothetical protein
MLNRTVKETHLIFNSCSNSKESQTQHRHHREAPELYRTSKDMATERRLYTTVRTIHNVYYSKEIARWFETALSSLWSVLFADRKQ